MLTLARWRRSVGVALVLGGLVLGAATPGQADPPSSALPTGEVFAAPTPVPRTDDRLHLVYEIVMRNPTTARAVVEQLVVVDGRGSTLASFGPTTLSRLLGPSGLPLVPRPEMDPGQSLTLFLDVTLSRGRRVPAELAHRFVVS